MPSRFTSDRDIGFFDRINRELLGDLNDAKDGIINQTVVIYKISSYNTPTNLYNEASDGKLYLPGVQIACLIAIEDFEYKYDDFGPDRKQIAVFSFLKNELTEINYVIEIGDIVDWNNSHHEVVGYNENQFVGGRYNKSWAIVCNTILLRRSNLNIEEIRSI